MSKFNLEKTKNIGLKEPLQKYEEYDPEQLSMGIEVEKEHTDDEEIAVLIAAHHLDEIPDYYTRLKAMEDESKIGEESPGVEEFKRKLNKAFGVQEELT